MRLLLMCALGAVLASAAFAASTHDGMYYEMTVPGSPPSPLSAVWGSATTAYGYMWVTGGITGSTGAYEYDWHAGSWKSLPGLPHEFEASDSAFFGGNLAVFGGKTGGFFLNELLVLSTVNPTTWSTVLPTAAPPARDGHVLTEINGLLYLTGGWNTTQYFNDVWAFDLTQLTKATGWGGATWVNVLPANVPGARPSARNGHSVAVYEDRMYLFGGFWHNTAAPTPVNCELPQSQCTFFNDLWMWSPGRSTAVPTSSTWQVVKTAGTAPSARYGHLAAFIENNRMLVFGGHSANLVLNDLWAYDEHTRTWSQLHPVGASPPALSTPIGGRIGRHLFIWPGGADPSRMIMYTPEDPGAPTPPSILECKPTSLKGVNAGLVLSILVSIGALVFSVLGWLQIRGGAGGGGDSAYASMPA